MAMGFRNITRAGRDQDYIINMDQSPISLSFDRQSALELVGAHMVHICKSTCDTKWARLAVTITASRRILTPVIEFKGMPGGRIAKWGFSTYPCGCIYECQPLAWMDEVVMLQ